MKHVNLLFLFTAFAFLFSCTDEEPTPENYFKAKKEAEQWEAEYAPTIKLTTINFSSAIFDSLWISGVKEKGRINIGVAFTGVGVYDLRTMGSASYYDLQNGEVVNSYYLRGSTGKAELVITEWYPETKVIKGKFAFGVKKAFYGPSQNATNAVENLQFTDGEFVGKVVER